MTYLVLATTEADADAAAAIEQHHAELAGALAALVGGLQQMLVATGEADNLVVLRKGATSDGSSQIGREAAAALRTMTGVTRRADGTPLASRELVNQPFLRTRGGSRENVLVRGVEPVAFDVHRAVQRQDRPLPADEQRDHHVGIDHDIAQRQHRRGLFRGGRHGLGGRFIGHRVPLRQPSRDPAVRGGLLPV